jgi:beta-lactamase superfamily II metal-dependent hydrolase
MSRSDPPEPDEFEMSVIGPGKGECVILHIGNNEWCVIDSCIARGATLPVAVEYLSQFGDSALDRVHLVIATHWHDDHIRGISSALSAFPNAKFCCSLALKQRELLQMIQAAGSTVGKNSGVNEFYRIFETLRERMTTAGTDKRKAAPVWAGKDRIILSLANEREFPVEIFSMSPSDLTITQTLQNLAAFIPRAGDQQQSIPDVAENDTSIVLLVQVGEIVALLGADLEHKTSQEEGWFSILASVKADKKSRYFKIPHHGSPNADCPEVWQHLLEEEPIAVITPYSSGVGLPRPSDLTRLKSRTSKLYCTSQPKKKLPTRDSTVERQLRGYERIAVDNSPGHVRIRSSLKNPTKPASIELFNGAYLVES